jgi:sialate O-acetylesterase
MFKLFHAIRLLVAGEKSAQSMQRQNRICTSHTKLALLVSAFFLLIPGICAEPRLPHLFSDHMVLQCDTESRIWGWADPGESIEVSIAGATRKTAATADGRWSVSLPAFHGGGPFVLEVRGKTTRRFKDVMFGEVWVASGQSNMTYGLEGAATGAEEVPKANDPGLRFFTVPKKIALEPQSDTLPATWEVSTSDTAKKFSAVAYFFARDLRRKLGVPVGVILSAWPGTAAEEWTDMECMRREPILQPIAARWDAVAPELKAYAVRGREFSLEFDDFELLPAKAGDPAVTFSSFDDGSSRVSTGGIWSYSWKDAADSALELVAPGRGNKGYASRISGALDGTADSFWNAKLRPDGAPVDLSSFAGLRFWVRGSGTFVFRTLQPTITDWDDYGSAGVKAAPEWKEVTIWFKDLKQQGWGVRKELTLNQISGFSIYSMTDMEYPPRPPSGLYEGMITPLVDYRIRGAIWYQGESNTDRAFQYRTLLPDMIRKWRAAWKEGDFPFLIVQLPNQGSTAEFADSWWAELREAQLLIAKSVPNTGLAVTIDVGLSWNLHPPRKEEIGERLALCALGTTYGKKLEYSGPIYESMRVEGKDVRISFQHVGTGLRAQGDILEGFTVAGAAKKFHHAAARIEGDTVVVSSAEVASPVTVRYAWADSPTCNLFNKEGLPASPFRTDDWPGATFSNR